MFQGLLEGSLSFMLSQASLKSLRLVGNIPRETRSSMPLHFRVFWKEGSLHVIVGLKGDIVRKTVSSNFENSDQLKRKFGSFFIWLLYSVNS